jgi:RNAse (barnase) inhibitor barstar
MKLFFRNHWWTIPLIFFIALSLALSGLTIFYYWTHFKNNSISNDTQKWAEFGEYFGGTLNTLFALINVCVTIWLTVTVNKFTRRNTDKQIEAEKKIATIQLRHEALKELRTDLDKTYAEWKADINSPQNGFACQSSVINFSSNYSYLFDTDTLGHCNDFVFKVNDAVSAILDNDSDKAKELFHGILIKKINLYSLIGRKIIQ